MEIIFRETISVIGRYRRTAWFIIEPITN